MFQTKKQDKIPEELSDMKIGIYSPRVQINKDKEPRRMSAQREKLDVLSKESENIKNNQFKNTITEMQYTLEGNNSRVNKKRTDRVMEITTTGQKKRTKRNEDSLREVRDNIKGNNVCMKQVPEGEERKREPEKIFEDVIAENSLTRERKESPTSKKHRQSHTG